jgi:HSP20 family protein
MIIRRLYDWPTTDWRSPFDELERMRRQIELLSGSLSREARGEQGAGVFPLMNVTEDKDSFYVRTELPGIKPDELDISVTGNSLSISGERKLPADEANAKYHRRERDAGKFNRIITMPSEIDPEKVQATSADGVLTIVLPKPEKVKPKQISVKAS